MPLLWPLTCVLLCTLANALLISFEDQAILDAGVVRPDNGVLTRFSVLENRDVDIGKLVGEAEAANLDIWRVTPTEVDIYFPSNEAYLSSIISELEVPYNMTVIPASVLTPQRDADSVPSSWNLSSLSNSTFHSVYHPLDEIEDFIQAMAALHPNIVQIVRIGHSAEGREMYALKISQGVNAINAERSRSKTGFVVSGAQHAREWIATSTALYLIHALVASATEPYAMPSLLDYYIALDFYIIPVPNPDGYIYTWEHDRLWYKNRQIIGPYEKCVGIDMNRNWGHKWKAKAEFPKAANVNKPSTPTDPCTPWYPGHRAFESPEVNNIANYITTLPYLKAFVDLRSYGQMLTTPFAYSCKKTAKDAEDQIEAAHGATRAIKLAHGTTFTTGTLCSKLYKAPGNVVDWMYAKAGIKYSYAVHLRDTGTYGFSLPPEWIRPVGEETANMIQFLAEFIMPGKYCGYLRRLLLSKYRQIVLRTTFSDPTLLISPL